MALFHLHVTQVKRSAGQSVVTSAAYRAGEKLYSEYYGEVSDYTHKGGVVCTDILLPPQAPNQYQDRATLWNAVEKAERGKKAQLAYSFDIALQNEFSLEENIALARQFVSEQLVGRGMIADFAIHQPDKEDGGIPNPHFHVLCPIRPIEPDGKWGCKQRRRYRLDEDGNRITLSDERIEKAIVQNGARLIILDPIQAYMGEKTDMNRANEVRPMFRRLADVAERTGCAVILIGHLNKAAGGQSAYRGLGSIDFRAAARSVLLIGRVKREPNVRVIVHDKSSLAPEGKPVAFCLDPETGFSWIGEYDITADELLSGAGGNTATKTEQAERLILDLLADGKELASEDIVKAAAEAGISERTVQNAKRNMGGILGARRVGGQWYNFIKKKQPPEPAS